MSEQGMDLSKTKTGIYESAWLGRWTRLGNEVNRNTKCSKGSMKLKGKSLTEFLDLFPNNNLDFRPKDSQTETRETGQALTKNESSAETNTLVIDKSSSSATQSMNVEHYYFNNNLFKECKRIRLDSETYTRSEIKRLKTNTSDDYTGDETKSMMDEGASGTKRSDFFHIILKFVTNQEPFTSEIKNTGGEEGITIQHPWIQRWCKKKATASNEGQQVNPKGFTQEKQFPSVAAMAMMRKALLGLTPTGQRKTNSLFVWNARDLK